jgi:hypothetical protein
MMKWLLLEPGLHKTCGSTLPVYWSRVIGQVPEVLWCSFLEADSVDPGCSTHGTVPNLRAMFMTLWIGFAPEFQVIAVAVGSPRTLTAFLGAYIVDPRRWTSPHHT